MPRRQGIIQGFRARPDRHARLAVHPHTCRPPLSTDLSSPSDPPSQEPRLIKHIANIRTSGTIVRSSSYLITRLLRAIDFETARTVVQLGVGTGCITRELLRRLRPDARLIAFEVNRVFVEECRCLEDGRLDLRHACAGTLPDVLDALGIDRIDAVVSSLPLAIMPDALVDRILTASQAHLAADGKFLQYQYSLTNLGMLERRFPDVRLGFTLRNLPPAFVYECSQQPPARRASLA